LAELDAEAESTLIGHNQAPHRASVAVMM
jgi:hypothetical protein